MAIAIQQSVVFVFGHVDEGGFPTSPWLRDGADDEGAPTNGDVDLALQAGLVQQSLWNSYPMRVSDFYDVCLHGLPKCRYIVATCGAACKKN